MQYEQVIKIFLESIEESRRIIVSMHGMMIDEQKLIEVFKKRLSIVDKDFAHERININRDLLVKHLESKEQQNENK